MPIRNGQLRFGYDGDQGLGLRLIGEVLAGDKTATCMPLLEYDEELLAETHEAVDQLVDLVDGQGRIHCRVRVRAVYETVAYDLDPAMLLGEGYGQDSQAFLTDHVAGPHPVLASDQSRAVAEILAPLPVEMAAVAALHDVAGLSLDEISDLTSRSVPALRSILRRGRMRLTTHETSAGSCRSTRTQIAAMSPSLPSEHLKACSDCREVADRLSRARSGESVSDFRSRAEEEAITRLSGREATLNTVFLVTTFELA